MKSSEVSILNTQECKACYANKITGREGGNEMRTDF